MKIKQKTRCRTAALLVFIALFLLLAGQEAMSQSVGDYRSNSATMNWNATSSWQRWNGSTWVSNPSQGYPGQNSGTGAVTIRNGHDVTLNVSPANSFTSLTVTGSSSSDRSTLILSNDRTLNTQYVYLYNYGQIYWDGNNRLYLPAGVTLAVYDNGRLWDDGTGGGTCNAAQRLFIGSILYATCRGNPGQTNFADINNTGGSVTALLSSNSPLCSNEDIELELSYSGAVGTTTSGGSVTGVSYELKEGSTTLQTGTLTPSNSSVTYTVSGKSSGTYNYSLKVTTYLGTNPFYNTDEESVTVNPLPQGSLSGNTICSGGTGQLTFTASSGTGPYTLVINGENYTNVISGTSFNPSSNPTETTTYTLSSITDANGCVRTSGFTQATATITVNPLPQGSLSGSSVCSGDDGYLTWTATVGTGPFTVVYNDGTSDITKTGVVSGTAFQVTNNQTVDMTFTLGSVTDNNGCVRNSGFTDGSETITVIASGLWRGTVSTNWFTPANWCGGVPTSTTDVQIPSTAPYQPNINATGAVCRNLLLDNGASLTLSGGNGLSVYGNWTNNGTFTSGNGTVSFVGISAQSISGTNDITFYGLTLNNAAGILLTNVDITVTNTLTFTMGIITTGLNTVIVGSAGSAGTITISSGYVNGTLRRYVPNSANPTVLYPVGDASNYTPVSIDFIGNISGSGYLETYTTGNSGVPPVASGLSQTLYLDRNWTISNSGVAGFASFSPTFTFVSGDIQGGANTSAFLVKKFDGAAWSATGTGTRTTTSTQCTGVTSFGSFWIGESSRTCVIFNKGGKAITLE